MQSFDKGLIAGLHNLTREAHDKLVYTILIAWKTHMTGYCNARRRLISAAALLALGSGRSMAQPASRTVSLIVGFPPGGSGDVMARLVAQQLQGTYAPGVIVENRPGAGGRLALQYVKAAPADGATLIQVPLSTLAVYPHVYRNLSYDPLADFVPVARVSRFQFALCVGPAVPASVKTLRDFAGWCKANPGRANYGSAGEGTTAHFAGYMVAQAAGFQMTHVSYKGSAPATQDLIGGHVAACINILSEIIPYVADGRLRALATTGPARSPQLPGVPTMSELGYSNATAEESFAVFAPRSTPAATVARLSSSLAAAVQVPSVVEAFAKLGFEAAYADSGALATMLKADLERWGPIVRATGFTAN